MRWRGVGTVQLKLVRSSIFSFLLLIFISCASQKPDSFFVFHQKSTKQSDCSEKIIYPKQAIVFLSETTHGSETINELKFCLIKQLIKNHGFKKLVFEYDFSDIRLLNRYLNNDSRVNKNAALNVFKNSFFNSQALIALFEWIRSENLIGANISVYGTDNWNYNATLGFLLYYSENKNIKNCIEKNQKDLSYIYKKCKNYLPSLENTKIQFNNNDYYLKLFSMYLNQVFFIQDSDVRERSFEAREIERDKNIYKIFRDILELNKNEKTIVSIHSAHSLPFQNRFGKYLKDSEVKFDNYIITFCRGKISLLDSFTKSFTIFDFNVPDKMTLEDALCSKKLNNIMGNERIRNIGANYSDNFIDLPDFVPSGIFSVKESRPLNFYIK